MRLTTLRRSLGLALLLAMVAAMLSPLLLVAIGQPAGAAPPATAGGSAAGGSAPDAWATTVATVAVQLGGLLGHRRSLRALRERIRVLEAAWRVRFGDPRAPLAPTVPTVPAIASAIAPTRGGA